VQRRLEARPGLGEGALELAFGGEDRLRQLNEADLDVPLLDYRDGFLEDGPAPCRSR